MLLVLPLLMVDFLEASVNSGMVSLLFNDIICFSEVDIIAFF